MAWRGRGVDNRRVRKSLLTNFIRIVYGVDFSWTVIDSYPTASLLADKVRRGGIGGGEGGRAGGHKGLMGGVRLGVDLIRTRAPMLFLPI